MIQTTESYKAAITGDSRLVLLRALLSIISPDISYGEVGAGDEAAWSRRDQLADRVFDRARFATLERKRWVLDGSWSLLPENMEDCPLGYVSRAVSGDDGTFSTQPWVEMTFSGVTVLQACSVYFSKDPSDGVPEEFTVEIKSGGSTIHTVAFSKNTASQISVTGFTVNEPDAIRVTVSRWSLPGRRMRLVEIIPGVWEEWDNSILAGFTIKQQANFSGLALPYGTCTLRMDNLDKRFDPRSRRGLFRSIEARQSLDVSIGVMDEIGVEQLVHVGKYYQHSGGWLTSDNGTTMEWTLVDIVGLLAQREYFLPDVLPTTLEGWIKSFVAQLGASFEDQYIVDPAYAGLELTADKTDIRGRRCGELMRWAAMATGTFVRADGPSGKLAFEPFWNEGNKVTLDNLERYPTMKANDELAAIVFTLADGNNTKYTVSGTTNAEGETISVSNPFIHMEEQALVAARTILSAYGGNRVETIGRGDPAGEIGDVDTVWLDESTATTGRKMAQTFRFQDGVLRGCQSTLLQADGSLIWDNRAVLTESGTWTAPAGVRTLRYFIVGPGEDGEDGEDGSWEDSGSDGFSGNGGKVLAGTLAINEGQSFEVSISDTVTTFGALSSESGKVYINGYTDVASGQSYARAGVSKPVAGSGDGGRGGKGGAKGNRHEEVIIEDTWLGPLPTTVMVVDNTPGKGKPGAEGALGCVVLYWEVEDV